MINNFIVFAIIYIFIHFIACLLSGIVFSIILLFTLNINYDE